MKPSHVILALIPLISCQQQETNTAWDYLFDGENLDQWDTYLGPAFGPNVTWDNIRDQKAIGHNNDLNGVFSIVPLDGEKVLRISGEIWGGIFTKNEFEDYHLQLQFKWGDQKWYPREAETDKRDSGLLYHGIGHHGENDLFWLKSQEFQIQEGDCGDFWGVGGTSVDIKASMRSDSAYYYDPKAGLSTFSEKSPIGRNCKKHPDNENKSGEWNTLDLYCLGGTSIHVVNDVVTMVLHNSRHQINDQEIPLTKGKIELQSEAAEVYYRNIRIRSISNLPDEMAGG